MRFDPEFVKDFRYSYKTNTGGKKAILTSRNAQDVKRKLDYLVNSNYSIFKVYYPNASKEDYKQFWAEFLKDELIYYKSLVAK